MQVTRRRTIEILKLTEQIEAELQTGEMDGADTDDERAAHLKTLLSTPRTARRRARPYQAGLDGRNTGIDPDSLSAEIDSNAN